MFKSFNNTALTFYRDLAYRKPKRNNKTIRDGKVAAFLESHVNMFENDLLFNHMSRHIEDYATETKVSKAVVLGNIMGKDETTLRNVQFLKDIGYYNILIEYNKNDNRVAKMTMNLLALCKVIILLEATNDLTPEGQTFDELTRELTDVLKEVKSTPMASPIQAVAQMAAYFEDNGEAFKKIAEQIGEGLTDSADAKGKEQQLTDYLTLLLKEEGKPNVQLEGVLAGLEKVIGST